MALMVLKGFMPSRLRRRNTDYLSLHKEAEERRMKTTTILLVDDNEVVRHGLRVLLGLEKDLRVVGEAADGRQAVLLAKELQPHLIIMDIAMPLLNGIEATRQIMSHSPGIKVIALTSYGDEPYVEEMMAAGAAGFVVKDSAADYLISAVRHVKGRGKWHFGGAAFP